MKPVMQIFLRRFILFSIGLAWISIGSISAYPRPQQSAPPGRDPLAVTRVRPPVTIDPAANITLNRARQLAAAGVDELATTEFKRAAAQAPDWIEAQRSLAIWQSRQQKWEAAAIAWNRVMTLIQDKRSKEYQQAAASFAQARSNLPSGWQPPLATPVKAPIKPPAKATPTKPAMAAAPPRLQPPHLKQPRLVPPRLVPPRLTQPPPTIRPTITAPAGGMPAPPVAPIPQPTVQGNRIAKSFPRRSTPSLSPRRDPISSAARPPANPRPAAATLHVRVTPSQPPRRAPRAVAQPVATKQETVASTLKRAAWAVRAKHYEAALKLYQRVLAINPQHRQAEEGMLRTLLLLKRYDAVEAIHRRTLATRPNDLTALHGLARVQLARKDAAGALRIYQQVLAADANDFVAAFQIAQLLTFARRYDAAEPYYRQALTLQPSNAEVWAAWGEALAAKRDARVRGVFERALELRPGYVRALLGLAYLFAGNGDYTNAITNYKAALRAAPRTVAALIGLGEALTYADQEMAAVSYYQRALQIPPESLAARLGLGRALIYTQRYKEGSAYLLETLRKAPDNEEAVHLLSLAQTNANARGAAIIIAAYQALLKRQQNVNSQSMTWAAIGYLKTRQGDLSGARTAYSTAYRLAPANSEIAIAYAHSLGHQDQWIEAAPIVTGVLRQSPENVHALALQLIIEQRTGNAERANALTDQIAVLEPASIPDAAHLARALREVGQIEIARRLLYRVAARNTADATLNLRTAIAAQSLGDHQAVIELCRRVLATAPRHSGARLMIIESLIAEKEYEAARQELAGELTRSRPNVRANILDAIITLRTPALDASVNATRQGTAIVAAHPGQAAARVFAGDVMSTRSLYQAALNHYQAALSLDEGNLQARLGLARSLYRLHRADAAKAHYQDLMSRAPDDTGIKLEYAQLCLEQGKLTDAELLFNQVLALSRSLAPPLAARLEPVAARKYAAEVAALSRIRISSWSTAIAPTPAANSPLFEQVLALRGLGEIRRRQARFAEATAYLQRALQLAPANGAARLSLAHSLRARGDYNAARMETERVLAADAGNIYARTLRTQLLFDNGQVGPAQSALNDLIAALPARPLLETYLAAYRSFNQWRNRGAALRFIELACKAYPTQPGLARSLGENCLAAGQWDQALEAFEQALKVNPRDMDACMQQARLYVVMQRLTEAEPLYRLAVNVRKDNHMALLGLAGVLSRRGNWAGALDAYRAAVKLKPSDPKARAGLARVLRYRLLTDAAFTEPGSVAELVEPFIGSRATNSSNASAMVLDSWL